MPSLSLHVRSGSWRLYAERNIDPAFIPFQKKVLKRDSYTCRYCGFQARDYQDVVNLDYDYTNNKMSNLVTACCFCAQCMFVESVGIGEYGGGTLIYLPEIPQATLNSFCHVLFCAITNDTGYKSTAQSIYRNLKFRSQLVEERFGEGTSDPATFGQLLIDSSAHIEKIEDQLFENVRLLPSRAKFRKQIERWSAAAIEELSEHEQEA